MLKYILLTLLCTVLLTGCGKQQPPQTQTTTDTIPTLVMQIQKCSRLYGTEVIVHKIITHSDTKSIKGTLLQQDFNIELPMADRKIAIPLDITLKAFVDMSTFSAENIKKQDDKLEIVLPDPQITLTASKINHQDIKQKVSLIRSNFSDEELYAYAQQGKQAVINDIPRMNLIPKARTNIAQTLIPMFVQMGYEEKNIVISFRKDFTPQDILRLIVQPDDEQQNKTS